MKFSDIDEAQWAELKPYLDTCLLPLTGLTGSEEPWEVTSKLEALRDVMDIIEIPYKGRIVTYPAVQYATDLAQLEAEVDRICSKMKASGFTYVIAISADSGLEQCSFVKVDLVITAMEKEKIHEQIQALWNHHS